MLVLPRYLAAALVVTLVRPVNAQPEHWALTLGRRVAQVQQSVGVLDRVVLVPDAVTYVDELARWSPRARWPVLFEDDHFAPMFIRRFQPARIVRRAAVEDRPVSKAALESVVVAAWGGDPDGESASEVFGRRGHTPPGVVITSTDDPAWTAGVALAAGRGQPLAWLDESFGHPNQALGADRFADLRSAVDRLVAASGYAYAGLGDAIETITLCRAVSGRVQVGRDAGRPEIRAVTDLLGRGPSGRRYAFTGWIFGDEVRCAYTAMCSLFGQRSRVMLYDTYSEPEVIRVYGMSQASTLLAARGFEVTTHVVPDTTLKRWLNGLAKGLATDVLVMNSSGNAGNFALSDQRGYCGDVPMLNVPLALHFTHSFSLRSPQNPGTIGGQWLSHGVYAYIGSVDEPKLSGFIPPKFFIDRCASLVPFLIAGRKWDDSPAWKINTLGDPLMICRPPMLGPWARIPPPDDTDGLNLRDHVKTLMREAAEDGTAQALAETVTTLDLLGEDSVAIRMWQLAVQRGLPGAAAPGAMGPLFRVGLTDELCRAAQALPDPDEFDVDMLWHHMTPRLRWADERTLMLLEVTIRSCQSHADLERLAPHLTATFGAARTHAAIERELRRTTNARRRRDLEKLLGETE